MPESGSGKAAVSKEAAGMEPESGKPAGLADGIKVGPGAIFL